MVEENKYRELEKEIFWVKDEIRAMMNERVKNKEEMSANYAN